MGRYLELIRQAQLDPARRTWGQQVIVAAMCGDDVFLVRHVLQVERRIEPLRAVVGGQISSQITWDDHCVTGRGVTVRRVIQSAACAEATPQLFNQP